MTIGTIAAIVPHIAHFSRCRTIGLTALEDTPDKQRRTDGNTDDKMIESDPVKKSEAGLYRSVKAAMPVGDPVSGINCGTSEAISRTDADDRCRSIERICFPTRLGENGTLDRITNTKMQEQRNKKREGNVIEQIDRQIKITCRYLSIDKT